MLFDSLSSPLILTLRLAPNTIILMMRLPLSTPFLIRIHTPILTLFLFFFLLSFTHLYLPLFSRVPSPNPHPYPLSPFTSSFSPLSFISDYILILFLLSHPYPRCPFTLLSSFSLHTLNPILSSHPYPHSLFTPLSSVSLHTLILCLPSHPHPHPYPLSPFTPLFSEASTAASQFPRLNSHNSIPSSLAFCLLSSPTLNPVICRRG